MDRKHQSDLRSALRDFGDEQPLSILAYVVPGGGKSRLPGILAERFPDYRLAWFTPRDNLRYQGVADMEKHFNIRLHDSGNDINPCRGLRGFITTHQALTTDPDLWEDELRRHRYAVIVDEGHHSKESNELARALTRLKTLAPVWLNMTGTLETRDNSRIHGIQYNEIKAGQFQVSPEDSVSNPAFYIRYDRATALEEKAIVPVTFFHHDGIVKYDDGTVKEMRLSQATRDEEWNAIFTHLNSEAAIALFENGVRHYKKNGRKLLIVTATQQEARKYNRLLTEIGIESGLAITDEEDSKTKIRQFKASLPALVTCAMAYEGMDVPDITHIICLTHIRSVPWIEQMLGRAWRQTPLKPKDQCYAFVPDDPRMERVIERIQQEQLPFIHERDSSSGNGSTGGVNTAPLVLAGSIDDVTESRLDGDLAEERDTEGFRENLQQLLTKAGISVDPATIEPYIEIFRLQRATQIQAPSIPVTPSERERSIRNQIARHCNRVDGARRVEPGTTQGDLYKANGSKSITVMSEIELQNAWKLLLRMTRQWPVSVNEFAF